MDVTKSMYEKFKDTTFPTARAGKGNEKPGKRRNYGAMIDNIDRWLGVFQDELKERGEFESTLIVYCSDHGEMLGDRGMGGKSKPYHPSACVPLVIAGPGVREGVVCKTPTETLDVTSTFLDFAGISIPRKMDARSLRPFLVGRGPLPRSYATSSLGDWALVFDGRYKLIASRPKAKESKNPESIKLTLYDLKTDLAEVRDVADQHPDIVARLEPLLPTVAPYRNKKREARQEKKS
jgi:arylsulfatase A-like enzyme